MRRRRATCARPTRPGSGREREVCRRQGEIHGRIPVRVRSPLDARSGKLRRGRHTPDRDSPARSGSRARSRGRHGSRRPRRRRSREPHSGTTTATARSRRAKHRSPPRASSFDAGGSTARSRPHTQAAATASVAPRPATTACRYDAQSWWELRQDSAPTTTLRRVPTVDVHSTRPPRRTSMACDRPVTEALGRSPLPTGPGLRVDSYDDVVPARQGLRPPDLTRSSGAEAERSGPLRRRSPPSARHCERLQGSYAETDADVSRPYLLVAEPATAPLPRGYRHASSLYVAFMLHQSTNLTRIHPRGLLGDPRLTRPRLGAAQADRRGLGQLSGRPAPRRCRRRNTELPAAGAVPRLRGSCRRLPAAPSARRLPAPEPTPSPSPPAPAAP